VVPPPLEHDLAPLRERQPTVQVVEDSGRFYVILPDYELPAIFYSPTLVDLMVMADYQYPQSRMDMFWTNPEVRCVNGALPQNADVFENYADRRWQRWSWHYPVWDPARHTVLTHLEVVSDRLCKGS
jgi:hypothetical protein